PASFWHEWAAALEVGSAGAPPASLRLVVTGSEAVRADRLAAWQGRAGEGVAVLNAYGLTETTITSAVWEAPAGAPPGDRMPIGRPMPQARLYLADGGLELALPGAVGELLVGGPAVARGYLGRPDLTAERFLPDPFTSVAGARLYRTGDLARRLPGGDLDYLGRIDRQVKVRGVRVEPAEIEAALAAHPAVLEAAVMARGAGDGLQLVACVVPQPGGAVTGPALRSWLRERLPEALVPAGFAELPALPRTAGGDRKSTRLN